MLAGFLAGLGGGVPRAAACACGRAGGTGFRSPSPGRLIPPGRPEPAAFAAIHLGCTGVDAGLCCIPPVRFLDPLISSWDVRLWILVDARCTGINLAAPCSNGSSSRRDGLVRGDVDARWVGFLATWRLLCQSCTFWGTRFKGAVVIVSTYWWWRFRLGRQLRRRRRQGPL